MKLLDMTSRAKKIRSDPILLKQNLKKKMSSPKKGRIK